VCVPFDSTLLCWLKMCYWTVLLRMNFLGEKFCLLVIVIKALEVVYSISSNFLVILSFLECLLQL
jgi:hypothetical protein